VLGDESIMNLFTGVSTVLMEEGTRLSAFGGIISLDRPEKEKK
jgi:hypothetical protein